MSSITALLISLVVAALVALIYFWYIHYNKKETLYLGSQMAMMHPNPLYFYAYGRQKDDLDLSSHDYYLENQVLAENRVVPFFTDQPALKFVNLSRPYRPSQAVRFIQLED